MGYNLARLKALSGQFAIVGIGATDFGADYRAARAGKTPTADAVGQASRALRRALDDCGLARDDIDGVVQALQLPFNVRECLGINPRWATASTDCASSMIHAMAALNAGLCECVALLYGNEYRTASRKFGGPTASGGEAMPHYVYYHPWGFSSQGAFDATEFQRYMALYGITHAQVGQVAVAQRAWARLNPNAIMQTPLTIEQYLNYPFIAAPLRLPDYCLINDGGVALIMTTSDRARHLKRNPIVTIKAVGKAEDNVGQSSLLSKLTLNSKPWGEAAEQVYNVAGLGPKDIDIVYNYDNFSAEIFLVLEGCGFCGEGEAPRFLAERGMGPGGTFPVNTHGGMLSEAYMHGWNHHVELVRQLRGQAGARQLSNPRYAQYCFAEHGQTQTLIYEGAT